MSRVAIMQPYFLPYIGYFQLIKSVDVFVVYDNIEFSKKGWIHRNRLLLNDEPRLFTLPLKKDSDYLPINQRYLSTDFEIAQGKLLRLIANAYHRAPYYEMVYPLVERILNFKNHNLFDFVHHSLIVLCEYLSISTKIVVSSTLDIDHDLRFQDKVITICEHLHARTYLNSIGGKTLYDHQSFLSHGIALHFLKSNALSYDQFGASFVPWLSIIDVMMFNSKEDIDVMLNAYELI
ncbi:WbqC family protein [Geojedonia litorea]|uniref:WbqC family protein n=1 Tax=Geojedonia litorea TaxID=1268269 RepID=A0ABV9MYX6_9FLAO